jgi:hypothetical protein
MAASSDLAAKFAEQEIVPKIIPNAPKMKLEVTILLRILSTFTLFFS